MSEEKTEKRILLISFIAGAVMALGELIFAIFSHSQSTMMDAVYDSAELIFIALILFLTPLFHKPISEKRPYGFFQIESIFLIIKGFMLLSVTGSMLISVIETSLSGGNPVNGLHVSLFQLVLGAASIVIYAIMKKMNCSLSSPTVDAELLGWKLDIGYSFGMSAAFFVSIYLHRTVLAPIAPYFDQVVAIVVGVWMLPANIKMLTEAIRDVFLFSPDEDTVQEIKDLCRGVLQSHRFTPVFYDITRTGRRLWISVYFSVEEESFEISRLKDADDQLNEKLSASFENCSCDLILIPKGENVTA